MASLQQQLEQKMDEYLVKKSKLKIPKEGKEAIVSWAPWIALIAGALSLLSALSLWNLARDADKYLDYAHEFSRALGVDNVTHDVSVFVYLSIIFIAAQGALMVAAFSGLRAQSKSRGWNLLLLGMVVGFLYGISILFIDDYRSIGDFILTMLGVAVGLFVLAQIKDQYTDKKKVAAKPKAKTKKS